MIVFFFFNAYLNPFGNITFTILYIHIYNYIDTFQYNIRTIKWAYTHNYREGDTHEKKEMIKKQFKRKMKRPPTQIRQHPVT